ncbi:MAG: hypothetical protein AB7K71_12955 [Polyangiaceae bacterium]
MSHVVIRTVRPYATEEEFLQAEGWTLSRKNIILLDQPQHPEDTVVRFELKLEGGQRLMRAEGSVVRFREADDEFPSQLELKFRRFDAAAKSLIEAAEALAALTEDEYEVIDEVEALSEVDNSAPIHTEPLDHSDPVPDSAPGVALNLEQSNPAAGNTQPLATQPLGSFESENSPYSAPPRPLSPETIEEQALDDAVASATREVRSSSLPAPPPDHDPSLAGSALKLDALISEALSEPPPAAPGMPAMTPLPLSDQLPTLLDNSAPNAATTPLPALGGGEVDELLALSTDAVETAASPPNEPIPDSDNPHLAEQLEEPEQLEDDEPEQPEDDEPEQLGDSELEDDVVAVEAAPGTSDDRESADPGEGADDAPNTRDSGVHPRPGGKIAAPTNREELLAKLRERRLRKTNADPQSGSGTSSGT